MDINTQSLIMHGSESAVATIDPLYARFLPAAHHRHHHHHHHHQDICLDLRSNSGSGFSLGPAAR